MISMNGTPIEDGAGDRPLAEDAPLARRGFAALSPDERRRLGSKGGLASQASGTANRFTTETARLAGRTPHANGTAHKWTSEEAREAGRLGGAAVRKRRPSARRDASTPA